MAKQKVVTRTFPREVLLEVIDDDSDTLRLVDDEIIDTSRWSIINNIIFQEVSTGNFYETQYSTGATEYQDESPWEFEEDVTCTQVVPVQVTVTNYKPMTVDAE